MTRHYYFAYGSNMNPVRVQKRMMAYSKCESGILSNYKLAFNKRSVKYLGAAAANVMHSVGEEVQGVVYHLKDESQILAMDPFEGYPQRYNRLLVPIKTVTDLLQVWVYIANPDHIQEGLKPATWYLNHLLSGRQYLTSDYARNLAATICLPESDVEPQP